MPTKIKKIKYGEIPKKVLNIVIGEDYNLGDYTLKHELDKYCQDIIFARYLLATNDRIEWFHAWSKDYAMILVDDMLNNKIILGIERNPPNGAEIKDGK